MADIKLEEIISASIALGAAKLLLGALKDNIEKFEKTFGEIKIQGEPSAGSFGFQAPLAGDKVH